MNKQPSKFSRQDFRYLMNLLKKAEEEVGAAETEAGSDKRASGLTRLG